LIFKKEKNPLLICRVLGGFRPDVPSNETIGHRAMNYVWSFFGDENNEKYCYHVNE